MYNEDFNKAYRVVTYNRCSTDMQEDSLNVQVMESLEVCKKYEWTVVKQYVELESGTSTENRSQYNEMMDDMEKDIYDVIVIKSLDRLMRNMLDWCFFIQKLNNYGKKLFIYMENKFYDIEKDDFMSTIEMLLHSQFSKNLSNKIKRSHRTRQEHKSGYNITCKIFGWDKVAKDEYIINEEEAFYYRYALQLCREGYGFYRIARTLYEMGARNSKGKMIDSSVWQQMCLSPRAYGCVVLHKEEKVFNSKKRIKMPEEEWVYCENALPPIISKQEHEEIVAIIKSHEKNMNYNRYHGKYPLSSKIVCGICGSTYHRIQKAHKKRNYCTKSWICQRAYREGRTRNNNVENMGCDGENIGEEKLLNLIEETSEKFFTSLLTEDNNIIERCLSMINSTLNENDGLNKLEQLKKELKKQCAKKDKLFDKLTDGIISDEEFKRYNEKLKKSISDLEQQIKLSEANTSTLLGNKERLEMIKDELFTGDIIKRAMGQCALDKIDKIIVNNDGTITINYNKDKILGLLPLCESDNMNFDDSEYSVTVVYDGTTKLKMRTTYEKQELIKLIRQYPDLTYEQYAEKLGNGVSKNNVVSRIHNLMKHNIIKRNEDKTLSVIGELE